MTEQSQEEDRLEVEADIERLFEAELRACEELESFAVAALEPWQGRPIRKSSRSEPPNADEILALLYGRATKTYKAALMLARKGYGEQARMLGRPLFEGMAVAHWVVANEAEARERFNRAWRFDAYQLARAIEQTGWLAEGASASGPEIDEEELASMRRDFGRYGSKLWTGHRSLRELVDGIESDWGDDEERRLLRNFLLIVNRDNNQLLHTTVAGLAEAATGFDGEGIYLAVGPSPARIERGLFCAYWTYAETLGVVIDRFEVPVRADFEAMLDRQQYDFRRLTADEVQDVGRNDPCPCGSGEKFKRCHEGRPTA